MVKNPRGKRGGTKRSRGKRAANLKHGLASGLVTHAEQTGEKVDLRRECTDCEQTGVPDCNRRDANMERENAHSVFESIQTPPYP